MRSPWQLIKGFASRRKSDEAGASVDKAVPTSDPQVEVLEQRHAPKRELEADPDTNSRSLAEGNETDRHPASIGADAKQPLPAVQTDPLPSQVADNVAPDGQEQPAPMAPAVETIDGAGDTGTVTTGSTERRAKAAQARENLGKRTVVKNAVEQPGATKKRALDEGAELDLEIKNLRLQLSTKLLEQNKQLRRMIERYHDT
ncbi:hypothetical protein [Pararhizobium sp. PWRC1-1]|uniref:hypothetical protein n=1 Tax=Pararhizobium sp. PWRC1-1 TaxID=2804566 RepID=UPI003CEFE4F5